MSNPIRGALINIPIHQYEGAEALGLTGMQSYRYIILLQAVRRLLLLSASSIIRIIRITSLILMIGVVEILKVAQQTIEADRMSSPSATFGIYLTVLSLYLIICWPIGLLAKYLGKQWR